jgi:hypothetical protein
MGWDKISDWIVQSVDDATLTPSDYTLSFHNLPTQAKKDNEVKEICKKVCPDFIDEARIYLAKKFDDKIEVFKNLIVAAKELKDMRTGEFRRYKSTLYNPSPEQIEALRFNILKPD